MIAVDEQRFKALSPTAFENLVHDLLRADALRNVSWRTPGADGGRDIEGIHTEHDLSGHTRATRWLIECKRYARSVDWPTVWEKVAYGDSGNADVLLLATSSKFSTRCLDEIEKWNKLSRRPAIRVWPGHELIFRLSLKMEIARKYGLVSGIGAPARSVADLALHLARMTQSVLAGFEAGNVPPRHIYAATSLSNLLYSRSIDLAETGSIRIIPGLNRDAIPPAYADVDAALDAAKYDCVGLNCLLATFHVISKQSWRLVMKEGYINVCVADPHLAALADAKLVNIVSFWSAISVIAKEGEGICLTPQNLS